MSVSYDPYDIWSLDSLGQLKVSYTKGHFLSKIGILLVGVFELLLPVTFRRLLGVKKNQFAHVEAMTLSYEANKNALSLFTHSAIKVNHGLAWGLPFKWFSKNGVYASETPYITNTPYVMEALIKQTWSDEQQKTADRLFFSTWFFLDSLKVLYHSDTALALSYAPIDEPRMVINANSYAAFAYALHAVHGKSSIQNEAIERVLKLVRWIVAQQQANGSWFYYADTKQGNFIDCFHSCFIIKNLLKIKHLVPETAPLIDTAVSSGWAYLQSHFYDQKQGFCRRFAHRSTKDPFRWELYDQAEYLGLLIDFGLLETAQDFSLHIERHFKKNNHWYCRIDVFGRCWGKDFMRWGIVPFLYHKARLANILIKNDALCVE